MMKKVLISLGLGLLLGALIAAMAGDWFVPIAFTVGGLILIKLGREG